MKVMLVELFLLFLLKFLIIIMFYLLLVGNNEPFSVTPTKSSG